MSIITREPDAAYDTDDDRWDAVMQHDATADGAFYYSVRTTGVYCRPSCPARSARRENVAFHATTADAEAAGFRPCRRCRPTEAPLAERRADAITRACRMIEAADQAPNLGELAEAVGMSRYHFHRVFREITGVTPKAYGDARRADRVRSELATRPTVTDAIYSSGFESSGRFYASATATLGMTPTEYRAGGKGAAIRFGVGQCSLGAIVVAASDAGVCAILLGDEPDGLVRDLQDRFPEADLIGGDPEFEQWMARVVGFVEAPGVGLDLPLDVRGTAFQRRVWEALREVPSGTTTSYSSIAKRIGAPKAVRAVGQACAANNLAVAIPCHRIVRTDGGLSGYRWGIERKRALLDREAVG
jgi:AraC family transcriptional regulator of adaptative response/methylated-DNA-[protein]-cysteine methyltransferase